MEAGADPLQTDERGETALQIVACYGQEDVLSLLLEAGSDANSNSNDFRPPNLSACLRSSNVARVVQHLLDKGANHNLADGTGVTALHYICRYNFRSEPISTRDNLSAVRALLKHGASVNARQRDSKGNWVVTPLGLAAAHSNSSELIKLLLKASAESSGLSEGGKPAFIAYILSISCFWCAEHDSMLDTFLDHDPAIINQHDGKGRTTLDWAFETHNNRAHEILIF